MSSRWIWLVCCGAATVSEPAERRKKVIRAAREPGSRQADVYFSQCTHELARMAGCHQQQISEAERKSSRQM
jgi:hypothetical protein